VADATWTSVVTYANRISAEAIVGLLSGENVPCRIDSNDDPPGLGSFFSVVVPAQLLHRARWVLMQSQVSERELTFLATGELSTDSQPVHEYAGDPIAPSQRDMAEPPLKWRWVANLAIALLATAALAFVWWSFR
jgi:hypothetical protein